jgi:hypothetical protein
MRQPDIARLVQGARIPGRPDEYWGAFPGRIIGRLKAEAKAPPLRRPWRVGGVAALAAACGLLLGFALWHRSFPPDDMEASLRDGRALRKFMAQFPGRLRAIVQDGSGLHTQLSDASGLSTSEPVWLEILDGSGRRVIVTFSGQLVRCGDRNVMVLSDVGGQVMLVGDGFFWSRQASAGLAEGVRIRAERIPRAQRPPKTPFPL